MPERLTTDWLKSKRTRAVVDLTLAAAIAVARAGCQDRHNWRLTAMAGAWRTEACDE